MRLCILLGLLASPAAAAPPLLTPASLDPAVPHARLVVPEAGRYTLRAQSAEGTALRLIDRMAGPLAQAGVAGATDGRLDVFLDAGEYRLLVERAPKATGRIALTARHVAAVDEGARLERLAPRETTLVDGQARGWWVRVDTPQVVVFEAAGRGLSTLQVWQDGRWLHATQPRCAVAQPAPRRPIRRCTLAPRLEAGLHRVVAYGGAPQPWTVSGDPTQDALFVQWGVPKLAPAGVRRVVVNASGVARFQAPAGVALTRLALASPGTASLRVTPWTPQKPFGRTGGAARIAQDARRHVAEVRRTQTPAYIEIEAPPGTAATLRWLPASPSQALTGPGAWRVSGVHVDDDAVPPTGVLYRREGDRDVVAAESVIELSPEAPLRRRFNLPAEAEIFLRVTAAMTVTAHATEARLRLIPLWTQPPEGYHAPALESALTQAVAPGLYRLELWPDRAAVTTLVMHAADRPAPQADTPTPTALTLGIVTLGQGEARRLVQARSPSASAMLALPLPLDVARGVPLSLGPGETVVLPIALGAGRLTAAAADGSALQVSTSGLMWAESATLTGDEGVVQVRNPSTAWVHAEARRAPASAGRGPLPRVTDADRALIPDLPTLAAGDRVAATLERDASKSWRLTVPEPGAWEAESTGLLATRGTLRTRTRLSVDAGAVAAPASTRRGGHAARQARADGGSGRNFGLRRYLRAGEYLLTVATKGQSTGRLGVRLAATPTRDAGTLRPDRVARVGVAAGEAVAWRVSLAAETKVHLRAEGPTGPVDCRLEDADGWPVGDPVARCDRGATLAAGEWRVILTPTREAGLRRVRLTVPTPHAPREGAGPHPIDLDRPIHAIWREPAGDAPRAPQVFAFTMPAAGPVALTAPEAMLVEIFAGDARVARVSPGRTFEGALAAGPHQLRVVGARRDDGVEYRLAVVPEQLLPGMTRTAETDSTRRVRVPLVVPTAGLYTLATDGNADARLTLLDAEGAPLVVQDDRPDDWNARITRRLTPGAYTALIELPERYDSTDLRFDAANPEPGEPIALGDRRTLTPSAAGVVLPIEAAPPEDALIAAHVEARENVGVAIEVAQGEGWRVLASGEGRGPLAAVRADGSALRLRIWSLDALARPADVSLRVLSPKAIAEAAWLRGAPLPDRLAAVTPRVTPGAFVIAPTPGMLMCRRVGEGCTPARPGGVPVGAAGVRFVGVGGTVSGRRVQVSEGAGPAITVGARALVDLPGGRGPLLFTAVAPMGQPGVALGAGPAARAPGQAIALDLSGAARQGAVWSTSATPINARMRAWRLMPGEARAVDFGRTTVRVPASSAVTVRLPDGPRALRALLPHHGLAAMSAGGTPILAWGAHGPTVDGARGVDAEVTLANPTAAAVVFELEVIADARPAPPALTATRPFEERAARAGALRLPVAAAPGSTLHLRGATGALLGADGRARWLEDGAAAPVDAGGTLVLRHGVGPVLAWIAAPDRPGPWAVEPDLAAQAIDAPRHVSLSGAARRFEVRWPEPRMLHLRVAGDVVLRVQPSGGATRVLLGGAHDLWLPRGAATLTARGLTGAPLAGSLLLGSSTPEPLTEGVGAPTLLGPGDTRLYRFETTRKAAVGIGVRADADRVRATVYDAQGAVVAQGGSVMPELEAGAWLLALHLPADAAPVLARPALVGVAPRGDGPPPSTIREYTETAAVETAR